MAEPVLPVGPNDLITVQELADWANTPTATDSTQPNYPVLQNIFQVAITGWSSLVLQITGRSPGYFTGAGHDAYTLFTETRDGNGSNSMGVKNGPIEEIFAVEVNGISFNESLQWNQGGFYIDENPNFISLRAGAGQLGNNLPIFGRTWAFSLGKGNVALQYAGGFSSVPIDLVTASLKACTIIVSKRLREDEGSRTVPAQGSVTGYRAYKWPPEVQQVLTNYTRTIMAYPA